MKIAAATDVGFVRENNEDAYWYNTELQALGLADGMGGHSGGELASLLAVHGFSMFCETTLTRCQDKSALETSFSMVIPAINRMVTMAGNEIAYFSGMGTTFVGAVYQDGVLHLTHIGDSRAAYISTRDGSLTWLTRDDNYAEHLVQKGELTLQEARKSRYRHHLTACIGGHRDYRDIVNIHYQQLPWAEGDLLLLCSDGLLDGTDDQEIATSCLGGENMDLTAGCEHLIQLALSKGGRDNCTVVLASHENGGADYDA